MMAGSSRVVYGIVQLLLFTLGILAAARQLLRVPPAALSNVRVDGLGWWAAPLGLVLISVGITLMESVRLSLLPWIVLVLLARVQRSDARPAAVGAPLGSFLGALAASLGASLVEAVQPQLPRLVVFLPAFWMLVPGSLGLLSVTELAVGPDRRRRQPASAWSSSSARSPSACWSARCSPSVLRVLASGRGWLGRPRAAESASGTAVRRDQPLDGVGQRVGPVGALPGAVPAARGRSARTPRSGRRSGASGRGRG